LFKITTTPFCIYQTLKIEKNQGKAKIPPHFLPQKNENHSWINICNSINQDSNAVGKKIKINKNIFNP